MIKRLHRRLATLLIAAIALALLAASGAALIVSERQLSLREREAFLVTLNALVQEVRMESVLSSTRLSKTEAADQLLLSIYENGQPVTFRGGWQPVTPRETLFARAAGEALKQGVAPDSVSDARWTGTLRGDQGERYLAAVQSIGEYRRQRGVVMLQDMQKPDAKRATQRWLFAGITLCAMAVMAVFSALFTARAVRPIETAHSQQNAFIAAASHELRTPLQVMQIAVDAIKQEPQAAGRFAEKMQSELNHMRKLTENLLTLTATPEQCRAADGPVELDELIEESVAGYLAAAAQKRIILTYIASSEPLPIIKGDEVSLQRALNVLIDNAICYTQPDGHVSISVTRRPHELLIAVEDDGPGIAEEHRPHIFERFYRADKSRTDRTHSGLGLCIAKQIVLQHGGTLRYQPIEPHGSRFSMCLPYLREQLLTSILRL